MLKVYLIVVLTMSILSIISYAVDKSNAIKGKWRIPENVLLTLMALGGVFGSIIGMLLFHHKTNMIKKWYFLLTAILSVIVNIAIFLMLVGIIKY